MSDVAYAVEAGWTSLLEETAEDLFQHAPCGHLSALADGTLLMVNQRFLDWTGYRREELVGLRRFQDLLSAGGRIHPGTHYVALLTVQGEVSEIALDLVCADGRRLPVLVNSILKRDADGRPALVRIAVLDASRRREYELELRRARDAERAAREHAVTLQQELTARNRELERLALTDPLTGAANRRATQERLAELVSAAQRHGGPLGAALIDIDHFKQINDSFGHDAGDAALHAVAERICAAARAEDVTGRWGGEEFLLVAPGTDGEGMAALCDRVRQAVAERPVEHRGREIRVTVSIGWARWAGHTPAALVNRADRALYGAKRSGRNAVRGV